MKNSNEAVERVLAGLRDTESPAGMERRVLDGLQERAEAQPVLGWQRIAPLWLMAPLGARTRFLLCGAALAGMVVIGFTIPAIRDAVQPKKVVGPAKLLPVRPSVANPVSVAGTTRVERPAGSIVRTAVRPAAMADSEESLAMSEMQAARLPAPPMPLTEQERLLLRIVHRNDPVEVAMLDPKQRNLEEMKEKAEYQSFFARPVIKQAETEQAGTASDAAQGQQQEGQQQSPSVDDNKQNNDNTNSSGNPNNSSKSNIDDSKKQ